MIPYSFKVRPSTALVLMHHVLHCEDAENDADHTVQEILKELDETDLHLPKAIFESALYCCNMENERKKFWHPQNKPFDRFLSEIIPRDLVFDRFYNVIVERKHAKAS